MSRGPEAEPVDKSEKAFDNLALTAVCKHDITAFGLGRIPLTQKIKTHTLGNYLSNVSNN